MAGSRIGRPFSWSGLAAGAVALALVGACGPGPTGTAAPASSPIASPGATGPRSSASPAASFAPRISDLPFARVASSVPLGPQPPIVAARLVVASGSLWFADEFGVSRIDPATGQSTGSVSLGSSASVAAFGQRLAIASYTTNEVAEVNPVSLALIGPRTRIASPSEIALAADGVGWAISQPGHLIRFDLGGSVTGSVALSAPHALVVTPTDVWVETDSGVARVDPVSLNVRSTTFANHANVTSLRADGALWATYEATDSSGTNAPGLMRIDPADMSYVTGQALTHVLPLSLDSTASLDSLVWASAGGTDAQAPKMLAGFNPNTLQVAASFQLPAASILLGAADGKLWLSTGFNELTAIEPAPGTWTAMPEQAARVGALELSRLALSDGAEVHVMKPTGKAGLPSVVLVPGGPVPPIAARYIAPLAAALAERGAVVYLLGYQSSASGKTNDDAIIDMQCAVRIARQQATIAGNPDRVAVVGHSYGALWAMKMLDEPDHPLAGCPSDGSFLPDGVVAAGGYSTITNRHVPIVMIYGSGDEGLAEGRSAEAAMAAAGVDVRFVEKPGIDHGGIVDPRTDVGIVATVFDLLARLH